MVCECVQNIFFSKNDPSPIGVPKRMNRARFEPILTRSSPPSGVVSGGKWHQGESGIRGKVA